MHSVIRISRCARRVQKGPAYGLGRGPWWRVWGPATLRAYAGLVRRGARLERPKEDTSQLGGDFVVDRDGRIAYAYRSRGPADRPPVDDVVAAVRALGRGA